MKNSEKLLQKKLKLKTEYRQLIENAYNFRQLDHGLSDFYEYRARLVYNKINKLKFIISDNPTIA